MTPSGQTICLCMIVKDEAPVIRRCLASLRSIIDHWLIVDTGSTDGTQDVIRTFMADLPGEVVERPWVDFGHNRTEALALARPRGDYSLVMDADDELALTPGFAMPDLTADSYGIDIVYGAITYRRTQLVRNALEWRYRGVLHEFLECPAATSAGHLPILMRINHEGRRSTDPQTYAKDAAILETALGRETDPFLIARYTFYLAQSQRDCGNREAAVAAYLRRAEMGFWEQEVFVALNEAARLMEALGRDTDVVLATYRRASDVCPSRAEAAHGASRLCRYKSRFEEGLAIATAALSRTAPADGLFVEAWIHAYGLLDELAVNAYWAGRYRECLTACDRLLREGHLPVEMRGRVETNRRFAIEKVLAKRSGSADPADDVPASARAAAPLRRCAVVTPYYKEEVDVLARCIESVRLQSVPADHFVVADGHPQDWISQAGVRHVRLDQAHGDYGGTPRGIGAMLAVSEGYDAIALLDADNWFDPDHLERCLAAADAVPDGICDYVIARLRIVRPDKSVMNLRAEAIDDHVDTSCFVFLRGAFHALPIWALMPREASIVGDRYLYGALREMNLTSAVVETVTVNYTSIWESHYRLLGETPPPGAKLNVSGDGAAAWLAALTPRDLDIAERLMQVRLREPAAREPRPGDRPKVVVASFFMANMAHEVVSAQRSAVRGFADPDVEVRQIRTDQSHAASLDAFMRTTDADVVIFLDIDCVPLHADALGDLADLAAAGILAGCVQRANHIANGGHLYVGPFCMALSKALWAELGEPSFSPTERGDVGEELTYRCEARGKAIHMLWPSFVEDPVWALTDQVSFGFNTEYDHSFLHAFGAREPSNQERFLRRFRELPYLAKPRSRRAVARAGRHALAATSGTDKDYWHRYTQIYEDAFDALGHVGDILEFGVLNGDSIRRLATRFPEARIVGADIQSQVPSWPVAETIGYERIDQGDRDGVRAMFARLDRSYDLLIEDGSHLPQHQVTCLVEGLPHVRSGKLFILEDVHTSHPDNADFSAHNGAGSANCLHVLLAFEHLKTLGRPLTPALAKQLASARFFTEPEVMTLFDQISALEVYRRPHLPLRCYNCGTSEFDYRTLRCTCGVALYSASDSMSVLIWKR